MTTRHRLGRERARLTTTLRPQRTLFLILVIVTVSESLAMVILESFTSIPPLLRIILDSALLVVFSLPLLHGVVLVPLLSAMHRQRVVEVRLRQRSRRLAEALEEKDVLLREVNHRVRNNLQLVAALLAVPEAGREAAPPAAVAACIGRIHAVALVHDHLLAESGLTRIDLHLWAASIPNSIRACSPVLGTLQVGGDPCTVHLQLAVPLALLVHELICGGHASQQDISIFISKFCEKLVVSVGGLPSVLDDASSRMVALLARQIDASVFWDDGKWQLSVPQANEGKAALWT